MAKYTNYIDFVLDYQDGCISLEDELDPENREFFDRVQGIKKDCTEPSEDPNADGGLL